MVIGVNLLYLIPRVVGGTQTYATQLLKNLIPLLSRNDQLILFCSRDNASIFADLPHTRTVLLPFSSSNRLARLLAEQLLLPLSCISNHVEILLSLGYSRPVFLPCKSITTIHDLNWYYCPEDYSFLSRFIIKYINLISIYLSSALISVSERTASDLARLYSISINKTHVIYHGVPEIKDAKTIKSPYPTPYLFSLLSHYPHKNLTTLIQVYKNLLTHFPDLHLVLGGTGNPADQKVRQSQLKGLSSSHLHLLPFLSDQKIAQVYKHATAFIFPSRYEGFGLPVLEAMHYGAPVVSSIATSLPEIVGRGGVLVDPLDVNAYVLAVSNILLKPKYRSSLITAGHQRAKLFSWQKCASQTYNLISKIYENK